MPLSQPQQQRLRAKFGDTAIVDFGSGFLSNYYVSPVVVDGVTYKSGEHAFQAQKAADPVTRTNIINAPTPGKAKDLGREALRVPGWFSSVRDVAMSKVVAAKLLNTGSRPLVEGNKHGDIYWGVLPDGKGENKLGLLLQERRTQLAAPPPTPPPPPPPAAVSEPASGAAAPSTAAPGAKRRKVEPEVLVVD